MCRSMEWISLWRSGWSFHSCLGQQRWFCNRTRWSYRRGLLPGCLARCPLFRCVFFYLISTKFLTEITEKFLHQTFSFFWMFYKHIQFLLTRRRWDATSSTMHLLWSLLFVYDSISQSSFVSNTILVDFLWLCFNEISLFTRKRLWGAVVCKWNFPQNYW